GFGEGAADLLGYRALDALLCMLGPVQNVALGSLEFAGSLKHHLDDVLHALDRRRVALGFRRNDVDHPPRQFGHRRVRLAVEAGEAARERVLDPLDIESDNPAVALDDCAGWYQAIPRYVEIGDAPFPVHRFDFLRGHATSPSIHMSQGGSQ